MISKTAVEQTDLTATQELTRKAGKILRRKIWLPRLIYAAVPYFYMTAGFAAFFATLYISDWFWILPHYLLFAAAICHLAYAVTSKRRRIRRQKPSSPE